MEEAQVNALAQECLSRDPFACDRSLLAPLDIAAQDIAAYFQTSEDDVPRVAQALLHARTRCVSLRLSPAPDAVERHLGFAPIGEGLLAVVEKSRGASSALNVPDFPIDAYYLAAVQSTGGAVLREIKARRTEISEILRPERDEHWFGLRFLRKVLNLCSPSYPIIADAVASLSPERIDQFASLLQETDLGSLIAACRTVVDRLRFLAGLELLLFSPEHRRATKERAQLHRIVAKHTWLFGEKYTLTADDNSLTGVLRRHSEILGQPVDIATPVVREDGTKGIVDLVFAKRVTNANPAKWEFLVVELKRPSQKIDPAAVQQIKNYAYAVCTDERFRDTNTSWTFWALSNSLSDSVVRECRQPNRPAGLIYEQSQPRATLWVKTWGQLINARLAELDFFHTQLNYHADAVAGMDYLKSNYRQYLPTTAINCDNKTK